MTTATRTTTAMLTMSVPVVAPAEPDELRRLLNAMRQALRDAAGGYLCGSLEVTYEVDEP